MTPALLLPAGLAALAALALPLLIHLARRTQAVPTDFAALRWLRQKPRPRHRPRFDELALLAARLLLVALLALFLARPVLTGATSDRPVVAVVPGAAPVEGAVWLAPGFPPVTEKAPSEPVAVASLVRELDADLPPGTPLTVRVPGVIEGADAERPRVSRRIDWRVVPGRMAASGERAARVPPLALRSDGVVPGASYLRAAATALGEARVDALPPDAALPAGGALAWFVADAVPARVRDWAARGNVVLLPSTAVLSDAVVTWRDPSGAPVLESVALGRGRMMRFTRPLTVATLPILSDADFADRLADAIGTPATPPGRVAAADHAPLPGAAIDAAAPAPTDARPWLAIAIALVSLVERWLATARRRAVVP